jgi:hypothetical protein
MPRTRKEGRGCGINKWTDPRVSVIYKLHNGLQGHNNNKTFEVMTNFTTRNHY